MKYRILKFNEIIRDGDEVYDNHYKGEGWTKSTIPGCRLLLPEYVGHYRRPLKPGDPKVYRRKSRSVRLDDLIAGTDSIEG